MTASAHPAEIPATGGPDACLPHKGRGNAGPASSRDGSRIAFNSNQDGFGFGIFVMDAEGSSQTRITGRGTSDAHPAWSPDGKWIAFSSNQDGNLEIYKGPAPVGALRSDPAAGNR